MTDEAEQSAPIPHSRLVPHEIHLSRIGGADRAAEVIVTIECERKGCTLSVETCVRCERFARIEPHEAGYTMLCRSTDSQPPPGRKSFRDPELDRP